MKVLLFGYGEMGIAGLEHLQASGDHVPAIVTHRDDPNEKRWFRSLAETASARRVPVRYDDEFDRAGLVDFVRACAADLVLSCYYRSMIPMAVLREARRGGLNLHGSFLPRLRGRAPTNWALVEGEEVTGVTLHHMVKEPDAGDIVAQRKIPIGPRDTAKDLFDRQVVEARGLLTEVWPSVSAGTAPRIPQDPALATYRGRRTPEDGRIDWRLPTRRIDGLVRAVTRPFPGAFTFAAGRKVMVWAGRPAEGRGEPGLLLDPVRVATGDGAFLLEDWEFADTPEAGQPLPPGTRLGGPS